MENFKNRSFVKFRRRRKLVSILDGADCLERITQEIVYTSSDESLRTW